MDLDNMDLSQFHPPCVECPSHFHGDGGSGGDW